MKIALRKSLFFLFAVFIAACGSDGPTGPSLEDLIQEGWTAFEQGDYDLASTKFTDAIAMSPVSAESYTGLGWSLFRLDNLGRAKSEFTAGSGKDNPSADLFAGWAFVQNALKSYADSNTKASQALTQAPTWRFSHDSTLDASDLHILKAENYFLIGDFDNSLTEVRLLNPNFNADVSSSGGQADLAAEIERLKGAN